MIAGPRMRDEAGVSLVELLIVILITSIIGAAVVSAATTTMRTERAMDAVRTDMDSARVALDRVRRELRGAHRVYEDPTGRELRFWIDRNSDRDVQLGEVITIQLVETTSGAELRRSVGNAPSSHQVLARDLVPNVPFSYVPDPPSTSLVSIVLEVDSRATDPSDAFRAEAQVRLRNVKN